MSSRRPTTWIHEIGAWTLAIVENIGDMMVFLVSMFRWLFGRRLYRGTLLPSMYQVGVLSVPVVAITGTFIGMVLAVQAYNQFAALGLQSRLGTVINVSLMTELGPVLAATMLAGRIGSSMSAEIGTMKVTEQIDALRMLGTDPIHYLVVPRFVACVLLIPLLTVIADFMGVIGGALVTIKIMHVESFYYWQYSRGSVGSWEIFTGLFKSVFFGAEIAVISCHRGFKSGAGAEGVGQAATQAFVLSFMAILASDFLLGIFLNGVYMRLWPDAAPSMMG